MAKNKRKQWFRPGNPRSLSWKGHVFPAASIARFARSDETVLVLRRHAIQPVPVKPNDELFCALRGWDHRTEHGLMENIEREFQPIAEAIITGKAALSDAENQSITRFWHLWCERFTLKHNPQPTLRSPAIGPDAKTLTQEQQENLEGNHYAFFVDGALRGPQAAGLRLMMKLGPWLSRQPPMSWNVLRSEDLEFLVPDTFGGYALVPIAPNCCLATDVSPDSRLDRIKVRQINELALAQSKDYVFAKDLRACF